jgi:hypothetical protein
VTGLRSQIVTELDWALTGPVRSLLGHDLADLLTERIESRATTLVGQLLDETDDHTAAETVTDLMCCLWPHSDPDPDWWATPLGRACGRSLGTDDVAVSQSVAAAMLGVTRGTIAQLVHRGTLTRHPTGGVSIASILDRRDRLDQP